MNLTIKIFRKLHTLNTGSSSPHKPQIFSQHCKNEYQFHNLNLNFNTKKNHAHFLTSLKKDECVKTLPKDAKDTKGYLGYQGILFIPKDTNIFPNLIKKKYPKRGPLPGHVLLLPQGIFKQELHFFSSPLYPGYIWYMVPNMVPIGP